VLFESPQRLARLLDELCEVCGGDRRTSVARELTKLHEEHYRGTLSGAARYYREHPARGEVTLVVACAPEEELDQIPMEEGRALARSLLGEGMKPSAVAREITRRLAVPRNAAYRIVHEVSEP
jgi:16S rRNA (cytidine1402-2'-O)-methyltransferase